MQKFTIPAACVATGLLIGLPIGIFVSSNHASSLETRANSWNDDNLELTFKRDYFEKLPKAGDGEARLLNVATFTFDADGDGNPDTDSAITVPLLGPEDLPETNSSR